MLTLGNYCDVREELKERRKKMHKTYTYERIM